jgi:hypothetical protein
MVSESKTKKINAFYPRVKCPFFLIIVEFWG